MKKTVILLFSVIIAFLVQSCSKNDNQKNILYFNSFESPSDTANWDIHCAFEINDDAPKDGGNKSISVSCGCIGHLSFKIPTPQTDSRLILSSWGKGSGMGGSVSLRSSYKNIHINVSNESTTWEFFQSPDTLFCYAGEELTIDLFAGGIGSGKINIDLLKVEKVE